MDTVDGIPVRNLVWDKTRGKHVRRSRARDRGRFIRGPIPLEWLIAVTQLRGKAAVLVALAICYAVGVRGAHRDISVSNELVGIFGLSRYAKRRALEQMATAGLIILKQEGKSAPRVTIVFKRDRLTRRPV